MVPFSVVFYETCFGKKWEARGPPTSFLPVVQTAPAETVRRVFQRTLLARPVSLLLPSFYCTLRPSLSAPSLTARNSKSTPCAIPSFRDPSSRCGGLSLQSLVALARRARRKRNIPQAADPWARLD